MADVRPARPEEVWADAAAHAVLAASVPEISGLGFWCGREGIATGLLSIDVGNGCWGMSWVEGGRAVLYGYDVDHSDTHVHVPPVDLLAGAPDWLPWTWLHEVMAELDMVAYVFWWDGAAWSRAPYPEGAALGLRYSSDYVEDAYLDLVDRDRYQEAVRAIDDLRRAARERRVARSHVEALTSLLDEAELEEQPDVQAALDMAEAAGVAPGATRPELPAGRGEPADRRVICHCSLEGVLSVPLREAEEAERPEPAPGPALERVAEWLRAHRPDTGATVAYTGHERRGFAFYDPDDRSSTRWVDPDLADLLSAWREEEAHPERGRWLYARIRPTPDGAEADRAYDRLPPWWPTPSPAPKQAEALRAEMRARDPRWRPDWAALLDREEEFLKQGVPPHLCWRPGA